MLSFKELIVAKTPTSDAPKPPVTPLEPKVSSLEGRVLCPCHFLLSSTFLALLYGSLYVHQIFVFVTMSCIYLKSQLW